MPAWLVLLVGASSDAPWADLQLPGSAGEHCTHLQLSDCLLPQPLIPLVTFHYPAHLFLLSIIGKAMFALLEGRLKLK